MRRAPAAARCGRREARESCFAAEGNPQVLSGQGVATRSACRSGRSLQAAGDSRGYFREIFAFSEMPEPLAGKAVSIGGEFPARRNSENNFPRPIDITP